jgi:hypothetical protein
MIGIVPTEGPNSRNCGEKGVWWVDSKTWSSWTAPPWPRKKPISQNDWRSL